MGEGQRGAVLGSEGGSSGWALPSGVRGVRAPQPRVDVVGASMDGRAFRRTGLKGGMQFSRGGLGPILPACWKGAD